MPTDASGALARPEAVPLRRPKLTSKRSADLAQTSRAATDRGPQARQAGMDARPRPGGEAVRGEAKDGEGQALSGSNAPCHRVVHRFRAPTTGNTYRSYYRGTAGSRVAAGFQRCWHDRLCVKVKTVYA